MIWKSKKRFHAPKIIHTGTPERRFLLLIILLLSLILAWNIFDFGREQGGYDSDEVQLQEKSMLADIDDLESDRDACKRLASRFEKSSQIDKVAAEALRKEIVSLSTKLRDTEKQLAFYRGLVNEGYKKGMQAKSFSLVEAEGDSYRYQLLLTHLEAKAKKQTYSIQLMVIGTQNGKKVTLDNKKLGINKKQAKAVFKHYHEFVGEIKIPSDMIVKTVKLSVVRKGRKKPELKQSWRWEILFAGNEKNAEKKEVQTP